MDATIFSNSNCYLKGRKEKHFVSEEKRFRDFIICAKEIEEERR
jgi:hypothetical protein